jgi:hypothetical protein
MILYTSQNRKVYKEVLKNGIYHANIKRITHKEHTNIIQQLMEFSQLDCFKNINAPIWCFHSYYGEYGTDNVMKGLDERGVVPDLGDKVYLKLEVPDNLVFITNYYEWSDLMFFTNIEYDEERSKEQWQYLTSDKGNTDIKQAIIPYITRDMIVGVLRN